MAVALVNVYQGSQLARVDLRNRGHEAGQVRHRAALANLLITVDHR
ncbi:MAG: hypothetical protein AB7O59_24010 [Pirellulales bacterium]